MQRREFIRIALGASAMAMLQLSGVGCRGRDKASALIPPPVLPFKPDALEPYISEATVKVHFGKHHKGYTQKANQLIREASLRELTVEQIIRKNHDAKQLEQPPLFNNVAQAYNHAFYWKSLRPDGGGEPAGRMMERLEASFGSYAKFRDAVLSAALNRFASGWVWLVFSEGKLAVVQSANADNPLTMGQIPLLTIDLWEHAYYLDYQNRRADYVNACLKHLVNWEFAVENLGESA